MTIEFHQVSKRFDNGIDGLRDVSATFEEGSMTFLTGHSGAGKSTFLKLLLCLERPTRGQVLVNGVNVTQLKPSRLPHYRRNLGAVFQDHHLLAHRSVFDNVAIPLRVVGMRERDLAKRVRAALSAVGLLERDAMSPGALSTGEQQRVGIARAVASRPKILLADEPTGNLDPGLSRSIMGLFEQFNQVGTTVIVASHDVSLIEAMDHRIIELSNGSILRDEEYAGDRASFESGVESA
ncbi:MAG: cell division ATP-binding protein FtsE [Pseudomonadales bacterium]|nr:cell division ATP-binding protein FtsE [Pseudomonadales bacterium]MDP6469446.1 cell division ATP-binding protein FtsE [Pseudomonadales bacterium]MDP6827288.1 cell division ATP-binding protein FtsE [Pseudomonadales bacterium]MDP6971111.1 cell division ATP-binding protein FtsE [Pseudomonadales bacterium]